MAAGRGHGVLCDCQRQVSADAADADAAAAGPPTHHTTPLPWHAPVAGPIAATAHPAAAAAHDTPRKHPPHRCRCALEIRLLRKKMLREQEVATKSRSGIEVGGWVGGCVVGVMGRAFCGAGEGWGDDSCVARSAACSAPRDRRAMPPAFAGADATTDAPLPRAAACPSCLDAAATHRPVLDPPLLHLASPRPASPHFTCPRLTSPLLASPHFTSPRQMRMWFTSSHLTSPRLTSPPLASPPLPPPRLTSPQQMRMWFHGLLLLGNSTRGIAVGIELLLWRAGMCPASLSCTQGG